MNARQLAWGLAAVGMATMASGGEIVRHRARVTPACGLPTYDYRSAVEASFTVSALSTAALLEVPPPPGNPAGLVVNDTTRVRFFQLDRTLVKVDHCLLSRVAVSVLADGNFTIAFQADQNPRISADPLDATTQPAGQIKQTSHLKRNFFYVRFRFYGAFPVKENPKAVGTGKPVMAEIVIPPFWVQRGEPLPFLLRAFSEELHRHFDRVDRVEVEFHYR